MKGFKPLLFLSLTAAFASCATQTVTVVHVNDMHSKILPVPKDGSEVGGFARLATMFAQLREHSTNMILLNGGDMLTGSAFSLFYKGTFEIELMNRFGFDATAVGNHEFDYGLSNALKLHSYAGFPFLSANVTYESGGALLFQPYLTTNLGGVKTVIVGLTTSDESVINADVREQVAILPEIQALSNLFASTGIDRTNGLVILLSHSGFDVDEKIAGAFPQIDLIVGGHTHTATFNPRKVNRTLIVQAGKYTEYVGVMRMDIRGGSIVKYDYELVSADTNYAEEPEVRAIIDARNADIDRLMGGALCRSEVFLDNSEIRNSPQPLGNFIADILQSFTRMADVTILNAGSIRSPFVQGTVTIRDVYEMSPFDNTVALGTLRGSDLLNVIERGITNRTRGAFLYYSKGLEVRARSDGTFTATLNGEPVDPAKDYRVAANDFLIAGGDGYSSLTNSTDVVNTGWNVRELIMKYLQRKGVVRVSDIDVKPRLILE